LPLSGKEEFSAKLLLSQQRNLWPNNKKLRMKLLKELLMQKLIKSSQLLVKLGKQLLFPQRISTPSSFCLEATSLSSSHLTKGTHQTIRDTEGQSKQK